VAAIFAALFGAAMSTYHHPWLVGAQDTVERLIAGRGQRPRLQQSLNHF